MIKLEVVFHLGVENRALCYLMAVVKAINAFFALSHIVETQSRVVIQESLTSGEVMIACLAQRASG